jgi:predicted ATP-grasp superfamily ATP-dependent carboligase
VSELVQRWAVDVLLPISDESLLAVLASRERFAAVSIPFADLGVFTRAADKAEVTRLAEAVGIAVPEQVLLRTSTDIVGSPLDEMAYPLVVKPARSVVGAPGARLKVGVRYARDPDELTKVLRSLPAEAFPVLLQRRVVGPGIGAFFLIWNGAVLARFAHRRIREKPPTGGVSVCCESIAPDPSVFDRAERLLAALGWSGPAMVEFKQERSTGRFYLMEINGRFWGSLQLAIDAGMDFPVRLVAAALGEHVIPEGYRTGVRMRWWWGEVDHLVAQLLRPLGLDGRRGGLAVRWRAIRDFLMPGLGVRNEVLRFDDPLPAFRETIDWFRGR